MSSPHPGLAQAGHCQVDLCVAVDRPVGLFGEALADLVPGPAIHTSPSSHEDFQQQPSARSASLFLGRRARERILFGMRLRIACPEDGLSFRGQIVRSGHVVSISRHREIGWKQRLSLVFMMDHP